MQTYFPNDKKKDKKICDFSMQDSSQALILPLYR